MSDMRYWPGRLEAWAGAHLLAGVLRLPDGVLRRLAGTIPPEAAGLHPEAWLVARLAAAGPDRASDDAPVAEQRRRLALQAGALGHRGAMAVPTEDVDAGGVPGRMYVPAEAGDDAPLLVYYHGGGWVQGSVATHDASVRLLAAQSGVRVLSVDYRLAPEHPYPAAVDDALAAYSWAAERFPGAALAVGGDSAGGNLAAVVALVARDDAELRDAVFQLLLYPVTDVAAKSASYAAFADGYMLTESGMDWFASKYFPDGRRKQDWRASPLRAADLSGLPPAYVATCVPDVLRDEGEAYAARLREAGVPVATQRHGLLHGFFNMSAARSSRAAIAQIAGALRLGVSVGPPRASAPAGTL
jgi:acetyl esterase